MNTQPSHIDNLIAAFLSGNADEASILELKSWIAEDETHEKYFFEMSATFHRTHPSQEWKQAFKTFKEQTEKKKTKTYVWYAAAAAAIIAIGLFLYLPKNEKTIVASSNAEPVTYTMQEGSIAALSSNTTIRYAFDEKRNKHTYYLDGASKFDIRSQQQVLVVADELIIEDIGTEFYVENYPSDSLILVRVKSGIVKVTTARDSVRILDAGEQIFYNKNKGIFTSDISSSRQNEDSVFDYQNIALSVIAEDLSRAFGVNIEISEAIRECRMTVRFENENLDTILLILSETLQAKVIEKKNTIMIQGNGCY